MSLQGLDLSGCARCSKDEVLLYDCFAVSNHFGSASGGHYTAFCTQPQPVTSDTRAWHLFDDSQVRPATEDEVVSNAAYVLFYRRRSSAMCDPDDLIEQCKCVFFTPCLLPCLLHNFVCFCFVLLFWFFSKPETNVVITMRRACCCTGAV